MKETALEWIAEPPAAIWDKHLAATGGHPLQSALWGDARQAVDGIEQVRWAAFSASRPVLMARCEVRRIARIGKVAWIPRGPAIEPSQGETTAFEHLLGRLRKQGFFLCVDDRYVSAVPDASSGALSPPQPRTAVVDFTVGRDRVWSAIDSQWRYGVRSASRAGVIVEQTRDDRDVVDFFKLCEQISRRKGFTLPGSLGLLRALVLAPTEGAVEARLFLAKFRAELAAGALVLRCGSSLHYFWGGRRSAVS